MKIAKALVVIFCLGVVSFPMVAFGGDYYQLPGIKDYKYLDADAFPWKPPYTPEMLYWQVFAQHPMPGSWWNFVTVNVMNHQENLKCTRFHEVARTFYKEFKERIPKADPSKETLKPGTPAVKQVQFMVYPPAIAAFASLCHDYYDTPTKRADADRWLYSASLRRTRRLSSGSGSENKGSSDFTNDDVLGREVFDYNYEIIGVDYLYWEDLAWDDGTLEYFKQNKDLLSVGDMPYMKQTTHNLLTVCASEICPAFMPTEDNPLVCVVVEATPKLPDYYLSKIITWMLLPKSRLDFVNALDVREEHYNQDGNLWKIRSRGWSFYPSPLKPELKEACLWHSLEHTWDIQKDHRTHMTFGITPIPYELRDKYVPDNIFDPNGLPNLQDPQAGLPITANIEKVYAHMVGKKYKPMMPSCPPLMKDKFPGHRQIKESLFKKDWIKSVVGKEEKVKQEHPNRKTWVTWEKAPEDIKKMFVAQ